MKKENTRNIILAFSGLILMGMGCVVFSRYVEFGKVQYQWRVQKKAFNDVKAEIEDAEGWIKQYEKERNDFASMLFSEQEIPAFLEEISQCAKRYSLSILDVKRGVFRLVEKPKSDLDIMALKEAGRKPTDDEDDRAGVPAYAPRISYMPIQVQVKGNFAAIVEFLDCMQNYPKLLNVASVKIISTDEYPALECQVTLNIYSLKTLTELNQK